MVPLATSPTIRLRLDAGLPAVEALPAREVPEPYASLLDHDQDMTSTLESFHGEEPRLRRLGGERDGSLLWRRVVLWGARSGRPLEFGQIRIDLDSLPAEGRRLVEEARKPLGAILAQLGTAYVSQPQGFFRLAADAAIGVALDVPAGTRLHGRRNVLRLEDGRELAEVIEILPPTPTPTPAVIPS